MASKIILSRQAGLEETVHLPSCPSYFQIDIVEINHCPLTSTQSDLCAFVTFESACSKFEMLSSGCSGWPKAAY
jgi:hypothetical protein